MIQWRKDSIFNKVCFNYQVFMYRKINHKVEKDNFCCKALRQNTKQKLGSRGEEEKNAEFLEKATEDSS